MAVKPFSHLKVGDTFEYDGKVWQKIAAVKKSCCSILKNAQVAGDPETYRVFAAYIKVNQLGT